jgi:hypothetical protein
VVKSLVHKGGANVHARNEEVSRWANEGGHLKVVRYLVERCEADLHLALRWARFYGHMEVVEYLKSKRTFLVE